MLQFQVIDPSTTPPGNWHYVQPESGRVFNSYSREQWLNDIRSHRLANGYPLTATWKEELEDELCKAHPEWGQQICRRIEDATGPKRFSVGAAMAFLNMLLGWIRSGSPYVPQEEAERRANLCATCPMNIPASSGCAACMQPIHTIIEFFGGERHTERDNVLDTCGVCSCSLKASVHFPLEAQEKNLTEDMKEEFRSMQWCWKKYD